MRAPRVKAKDVRVGDWVLTVYGPRTWQQVTEAERVAGTEPRCVRIDTARCRVWFDLDELVPCKASEGSR